MKFSKFLLIASCAVLAIAGAACGSKTAEKAEEQAAESTETVANNDQAVENDVIVLDNDEMFRPGQNVDKVTVLDFNATWCVPCKKLAPAFHEAAKAFGDKAVFYSVDIDQLPLTAAAFNIESIPTVVILKTDGTQNKFVGLGDFATEEELTTASAEELNDIILANMTKLINDAM